MKIAIVGAGISGLVAAHLLHREHEITVFEAADWIGGHTHTVPVETEAGVIAVDTGFIVMNDRNYPVFTRLLSKLGVATQASDMSFSVSDGASLEYSSTSVAGLFANPRHAVSPAFIRMLADVRRFQREAPELLEGDGDGPSLRDYLAQRRYSTAFVEWLVVPQASAVWSADSRQMSRLPARFLVQFFHNHGMLALRDRPRWSVIAGGSHSYVRALTAPFADRIRTRTPVTRIARRAGGGVDVELRGGPGGPGDPGRPERFDRVVVATHSDQALHMLERPTDREHEILGAIPYQPNDVVLHGDRTLLPRRRRAWASWNYHLLAEPKPCTTVTYHMNRLQALRARDEYCVTLNRTEAIDPAKVIAAIDYAHPVFTADGIRAQGRVEEISGVNRTHYCGAYWRWGFHEDGVVSALRVASRFGATL
jgi:predicted NAD/FAD-binding protein